MLRFRPSVVKSMISGYSIVNIGLSGLVGSEATQGSTANSAHEATNMTIRYNVKFLLLKLIAYTII
jgi:hypothetical protein